MYCNVTFGPRPASSFSIVSSFTACVFGVVYVSKWKENGLRVCFINIKPELFL